MIIDFQTHILTHDFLKALQVAKTSIRIKHADSIGLNWVYDRELGLDLCIIKEEAEDVNRRLKIMNKFGIGIQVLSPPFPGVVRFGKKDAVKFARILNDGMAKIFQKYPDRFVGLATIPFQDMSAAVDELRRSVQDLGFNGVNVFSSEAANLGSAKFATLIKEVVRLNVPLYIHQSWPIKPSFFAGRKSEIWPGLSLKKDHELALIFGWPFDLTLALSRLVLSGLLERFPDLKVAAGHLGGMISFLKGRLDTLYKQYHPKIILSPSELLKRIKYDIVLYDAMALMVSYEFVGPNGLLFGSDFPFGPEGGVAGIETSLKLIKEMKIHEDEKFKIFEENARRLLRI